MAFIAPYTMFRDHLFTGEPVGPRAGRQIVFHISRICEHRCHEQIRTEHILTVKRAARRVIREFDEHRAHHWGSVQMRLQTHLIQIRHQGKLELGESAGHIDGGLPRCVDHTILLVFLIEQPWHAIHGGTMHTRVGTKQSESHPTLVDRRIRIGTFETTNVMAPEAETGAGNRQSRT